MFNFIKKMFSQEGKEKDLICGMMVDTKTTQFKSIFQEKTYYFCSEHCKKQFDENPKQYIS